MPRIGCFSLIIMVLLLISFGWYKTSYLPKKIVEHAILHTINNSSKFKDRSDQDFVKCQKENYRIKPGLFCDVKTIDNTEFELCTNSPSNYQDNIKNPLADSQSVIKVLFPDNRKPIQITIDLGDYAGSNNASITSSDSYFFIAWKHRNPSNNIYSIKVKTIEKSTGKEISERNVLSKGFGIENLAIGFSHKANSILLSWNDYSLNSSEDLILGNINVTDLLNTKKPIVYKQVLTQDKWDKRNPYFLTDGNNVYFAHSTGDHWGIAAYSGKLSIGISLINAQLFPVQYSTINAKTSIGEVLKIQNGIIYYTKMSSNGSSIEEIRRIPFSKAFKHPTVRSLRDCFFFYLCF